MYMDSLPIDRKETMLEKVKVSEGEGFEPGGPCGPTVFKTINTFSVFLLVDSHFADLRLCRGF